MCAQHGQQLVENFEILLFLKILLIYVVFVDFSCIIVYDYNDYVNKMNNKYQYSYIEEQLYCEIKILKVQKK